MARRPWKKREVAPGRYEILSAEKGESLGEVEGSLRSWRATDPPGASTSTHKSLKRAAAALHRRRPGATVPTAVSAEGNRRPPLIELLRAASERFEEEPPHGLSLLQESLAGRAGDRDGNLRGKLPENWWHWGLVRTLLSTEFDLRYGDRLDDDCSLTAEFRVKVGRTKKKSRCDVDLVLRMSAGDSARPWYLVELKVLSLSKGKLPDAKAFWSDCQKLDKVGVRLLRGGHRFTLGREAWSAAVICADRPYEPAEVAGLLDDVSPSHPCAALGVPVVLRTQRAEQGTVHLAWARVPLDRGDR